MSRGERRKPPRRRKRKRKRTGPPPRRLVFSARARWWAVAFWGAVLALAAFAALWATSTPSP
jgi:cell division septal protein FtsQ